MLMGVPAHYNALVARCYTQKKKKTKSGIKTETEAENETETKMWAVSTSEQGTEGSASVG